MLACNSKEKYGNIKMAEYIYYNIKKAKISAVEFLNQDNASRFEWESSGMYNRINLFEKEFKIKDKKTEDFLTSLVCFNIKNYFMSITGRKHLRAIRTRQATKNYHVKVIRDKDEQKIAAAFVLGTEDKKLYHGSDSDCAQIITFFVEEVMVSVDFMELLFKENNKFIYIRQWHFNFIKEMIDYLKQKK